ncbi:MAG TPA: hypothetical protein ENN76_02505 [Euryarchaeota archaeon]|nr:hypothetical protein [Euryarchaeota archaeon]
MHTSGEGKYQVWMKKEMVGNDLVYIIGGGERPHLGGMTICEPGKTPINFELEGHFDCTVTGPIAGAACEKYGVKTVCLGGVHVDNASKKEIDILVKNCKALVQCV